LSVEAAEFIGDFDGEGVCDGFALIEVLDDGSGAVGAVGEGVGPLTGVAVESE